MFSPLPSKIRIYALVALLPIAGCLWSSQVNNGPFTIYNGPSAIVDVEVDSSRSL